MRSNRVAGRINFHLTCPNPIGGLGIEPPIPLAVMPLDALIY